MYPREMETGSKERDGGREGKWLAYERGSVRGERLCVIINRIVFTCTGNVLRMIMKKHLFDVSVEQVKKYLFKKKITINKLSRTEYKKLAHFWNGVSVLGRILERGIKNWPISRTTYQF